MRKLLWIAAMVLTAAAVPAVAGPGTAGRLLRRGLAERDPTRLAEALAADEDGTAFRHELRLRDYAVLSRFRIESAAAREILARSVPEATEEPPPPGFSDLAGLEAWAKSAGVPRVLALSAALSSNDVRLAAAAADRLAGMGDERALAPLRDALDAASDPDLRAALSAAWDRLTKRFPEARGVPPAILWLDLAEDTLEGRFPRGEGSVILGFAGGPFAETVSSWLYEAELAGRAAERALALAPGLAGAAALSLRIRAARELAEAAVGADAGSSFSTAAPAPPDPAVLALALARSRRERESEIRAWLFGLMEPEFLAQSGPAVEELVLALTDEDPWVKDAALRLSDRIRLATVFEGRALSDTEFEAALEATRAGEIEVADQALAMLGAAELTPAQREALSRARPEPTGAGDGSKEREPMRVKVFYGTDRAVFAPDGTWYATRFLPAAVMALLAFVLPFVLGFFIHPRFRWFARASRWIAVAAAVVLAVAAGYGAVRTKMRLDRLGIEYGGEWGPFDEEGGPYAHLGTLTVGIPPGHELGEVERPGLLSGELWEDPEDHILILDIEPKEKDAFFGELAEAGRERAFVFVHGFNVTFEAAALRTAQIAHDLEFDGAPIFFSWPSRGEVLAYTVDENTVAWATRHLKAFLRDVRRTLPAATIHLVAHSMGNRALTEALRRLAAEIEAEGLPRFQEVVLAAPDIDAATFRDDIAPAIRGTAERITLYASAHDKALAASREVHGYSRAGDAEEGILTVPGIQSVEVAAPEKDLLGHSYIGNVGRVLDDLVSLLLYRRNPERRGLERVQAGLRRFWRLR